jgi:hypothetical protein
VNALPIIFLLGIAALEPTPDAPTPAGPAPEAGEPGYWEKAPPGTPEDVALWNALRDSQSEAMLHMGRIGQASFRIRYGRYYEQLDEVSRTAPLPRADEARRLRTRIEVAAKQADDGIPKKGLRVRVCKYSLLNLDQRMRFPGDAAMAADLPKVRAEVRSCTDELAPFAAKLRPLADALELALTDADAFLEMEAPVPPPAPPGGKDGARP